MKEHKTLIIFSIIFSVITLISSLYFNYKGLNMCYDISISIFTALIVMLCTSLISYSKKKTKALEGLYEEVSILIRRYIELQYYRKKDLEAKIDGAIMLSEIDYLNLDKAYGNISFILDKGKGRRIVADLYHYIGYIRKTINENAFHLKLHKKGEGTNKEEVLNIFIKPVYDLFYKEIEYNIENKEKIKCSYSEDIAVDELSKRQNYLYDYMYSKKYNEDGEKEMKKWHFITKILFQIFLLAVETVGFTILFVFITSKYVGVYNIVDMLERAMLGFAIYEVIIYIILNMITDINKDSYLALKTNYERAILYIESNNKQIEEAILKNIDYQLDMGTINSFEVRDEYKLLKGILDKKDIDTAKYKAGLYNHLYELEDLKWRYSILLRIFK